MNYLYVSFNIPITHVIIFMMYPSRKLLWIFIGITIDPITELLRTHGYIFCRELTYQE